MGSEFGHRKPKSLIIADPDPAYRRICRDAIAFKRGTDNLGTGKPDNDKNTIILEANNATTLADHIYAEPDAPLLIDPVIFSKTDLICLQKVKCLGHTGPIAICTRESATSNTIALVRSGAENVLVKPSSKAVITEAILDLTRPRMLTNTESQETHPPFASDFAGFVGQSEDMQAVYAQIRSIAKSTAPAFITGESGTGKELCAEAIHQLSTRAERPLISLNCSAIPRDLMESEIFGHVKGAFTGAVSDRPGAAELAHGGTLFLDEVCEMHPALQAKLLRFIQTGVIRRVGDSRDKNVDIRFICATNRDPRAEVNAGNFREDLYYRLHVIPIRLSPLRARMEDILPIAQRFLNQYTREENSSFDSFSTEAVKRLRAYDWPGNVRQLQNVVRHLIVLNQGEVIDGDMVSNILEREHGKVDKKRAAAQPHPQFSDSILPFSVQERRIIEHAVTQCGGNIVNAAIALAISPSTIYRKLQSWQHGDAQEKFVFSAQDHQTNVQVPA